MTGPSPDDTPAPALRRLVRRARAALLWERVWPPLAAAGSVMLVFLALSWLGLFELMPPFARAACVAALGIALFVALYPLVRLTLPADGTALARIDRASGGTHRPATALSDRLASPADDPVTRALWSVHRERAAERASGLRAGTAHPQLAARDPRALRFAAVLAALIAFVVAGDDRGPLTFSAFDWRSPAGGTPPRLDAWVTPPPYTARAPIFLTASSDPDRDAAPSAADANVHTVPAGSVLVVRASGGRVSIEAPDANELPPDTKAASAAEGTNESRFTLDRSTDVSVEGTRTSHQWHFEVTPDAPPSIAFRAPPRIGPNNTLSLDYTANDDYGIVSADALIGAVPDMREARGKPAAARPLYGPPEIRLALPQTRSGPGDAVTNAQTADHPWAGSRVVITLRAKDEPGQEGRSEPIETLLPERPFAVPLARALVEQRRVLALDGAARPRVMNAIDALSLFPERFTPEASIYLGLRAIHARLFYARSDDDLRGAADLMWEMALKLEDGDLPRLSQELQQAEQNLRDALDRDAPDEEIAKLMEELREAIDKYIQEMARQMERSPNMQAEIPPGAQLLSQEDLNRMLDRMEDLARGGNRDAARDLLSELRDMLNSLQSARPGQMDEGSEAAARAMDELGRMVREQSDLRDRTFREREPGAGQRQRQSSGEQGQSGEGQEQNALGALGQEQNALRERLNQLLSDLDGMGLQSDPSLGDAGEEMGSAEGHLGAGDANRAFNAQGRALEALRKGAQGMAEQMAQGQGQAGQQPGQAGTPRPGQRAGNEDVDPLGRPTRARRYDPGSNVRVPGEIEAQRARRVLEELRRRLSDPSRPQIELDYLERLLRN